MRRYDRAHELSFRVLPLLFFCARLAADKRNHPDVRAAFGTLGEDILALVEITLGAIAPLESGKDTPAGRELARARARIQAVAPKRADTDAALDELERERRENMLARANALAEQVRVGLDEVAETDA